MKRKVVGFLVCDVDVESVSPLGEDDTGILCACHKPTFYHERKKATNAIDRAKRYDKSQNWGVVGNYQIYELVVPVR